MTRPIWTIFVCSVVLQVLAPSSAFAWWEYIDALSGPKVSGPHFEARLLCFMEPRPNQGTNILGTYSIPAGITFPCVKRIPDGPDLRRRFSIDLGVRWHWDDHFPPANRRRVNFVAVTPVFTWYLPLPENIDVVDVSAGIGAYWFISNAFNGHRGHLYDIRADVHLPTFLRAKSKWMVLVPAWRRGRLTFPDEFAENAFADTRANLTSKVMGPNETVNYWGFFFDLDALLRHKN